MEAICIYPNKISRLVTNAHNRDGKPCKRWDTPDFSGYVAADELYEGPFCILSAVDNRRYKRILYDVLDHDPTHEDIRVFLGRLKTALVVRGLALCGVTTDGSALYPEPLREVFGKVRHQICQFHIIKDIVNVVVASRAI